jgi:hypothetical protein
VAITFLMEFPADLSIGDSGLEHHGFRRLMQNDSDVDFGRGHLSLALWQPWDDAGGAVCDV